MSETQESVRQFGTLRLRSDRPFFIAEAGVNHEGRLDEALRMVDAAADAGADAIKFQSYKAESLAARKSPSYWDLKSEPTRSQFELFKKYDRLDAGDYAKLAAHARDRGIMFLSTPFDLEFADALDPMMEAYKIASADLTNDILLRHCARKGKPMILSTGASLLSEVFRAVELIRQEGNHQIALLHCVLSYPCRPADANLRVISTLQRLFPDCVAGYSDHVPPMYGGLCLTTAWLQGALILEKHFTLDKTKPGNDHYHAFDPADLAEFRTRCRHITELLGDANKGVFTCETGARENARRSLVARKAIRSGEQIMADMVVAKRPGTGIHPEHLSLVVGSCPNRDVEEDEILTWDMLLTRPASSDRP